LTGNFISTDFRNTHRELHSKNQIIEDENYIPDRYNDVFFLIDDEDHELDEINNEILKHNQELLDTKERKLNIKIK
tara:strand:- start:156 stop:383 length:228 start_codon:yes stop_codon:yes gene_type:complete